MIQITDKMEAKKKPNSVSFTKNNNKHEPTVPHDFRQLVAEYY